MYRRLILMIQNIEYFCYCFLQKFDRLNLRFFCKLMFHDFIADMNVCNAIQNNYILNK